MTNDSVSAIDGPVLPERLRGWRDFIGTRLNHPDDPDVAEELREDRERFMDDLKDASEGLAAYGQVVVAILAAAAETCPPQPDRAIFWHRPGCDGNCLPRFQLAVQAAIEGTT